MNSIKHLFALDKWNTTDFDKQTTIEIERSIFLNFSKRCIFGGNASLCLKMVFQIYSANFKFGNGSLSNKHESR